MKPSNLGLSLLLPEQEVWTYRGRTICIGMTAANEHAVFAKSLGLPVEDLNYYYTVIIFDGTPNDHSHMNVPNLELEDYVIRKELIESWVQENLPRRSMFQVFKVWSNFRLHQFKGKRFAE